MNETLVIAIISLIGTLFGSFGGIITSSKLSNYRIEQLEKKVQQHNNLIDRTYKLERNDEVYQEKFNVMVNRISELEKTI